MSDGRIFFIHHGRPVKVGAVDWMPPIDCCVCRGQQVDSVEALRDGNSIQVTVRCHKQSQVERLPLLDLFSWDFEVGPAFHPEQHLIRRVTPPPAAPRLSADAIVRERRELASPIGCCPHGVPTTQVCGACAGAYGL